MHGFIVEECSRGVNIGGSSLRSSRLVCEIKYVFNDSAFSISSCVYLSPILRGGIFVDEDSVITYFRTFHQSALESDLD